MVVVLTACRREILELPEGIRGDLADALARLDAGHSLSMPLSRPMPSIGKGVHELRLRDRSGTYRSIALLEFAPGFSDPNWCDRPHLLLVLEGSLELELSDGISRLATGECGIVDRGTRRRARTPGGTPCVLFVLSDIELGTPIP